MMRTGRHNRRGFTLLEMLVATALTALAAASLYSALAIAFRARASALAAIEPARAGGIAGELLRQDIEFALPPTGSTTSDSPPSGVLAGAFTGEDATTFGATEFDLLSFYTTSQSPEWMERTTNDIHKVEITCEPSDDNSGAVLVRRVTDNLLAPQVPDPVVEVLCRHVASFNLRYYDGLTWQDAWDSTTLDNLLPLAVEVTLVIDPTGKATAGSAMIPETLPPGAQLWSRVFPIHCARLPEATGTTGSTGSTGTTGGGTGGGGR